MNFHRIAGLMVMALTLAGCAGQTVTYYTLLPDSIEQSAQPASAQAMAPYAISVQAVDVPPEVDRPQILFTRPDTAQVIPLNAALWASPLSDQIRLAVVDELTRSLHTLDTASSVAALDLPVWKINLRVHRFESLFQQRSVLDVSWLLTPVNIPNANVKLCGAQIQIPVQDTVSAMVKGHQLALRELSGLIAGQLQNQPLESQSTHVYLKGCTY
ncbi:MAG: membrane integrity-associated transporter subunit PqiC [Burkholderiaceae bacterium]|nr:membrane integrity-associated transporter subunit PqiC [Burkholderiaceae bacterium]